MAQVTSLGKFLRILRVQQSESLRAMAKKIGVSGTFLSAVELGHKKMPLSWLERFQKAYDLNEAQMLEFKKVSMESAQKIILDIKNATPEKKELAILFAQRISEIDEKTVKGILVLLQAPLHLHEN